MCNRILEAEIKDYLADPAAGTKAVEGKSMACCRMDHKLDADMVVAPKYDTAA